MITFKPIALEDKELISCYYPLYGNGDCNFPFMSLYARQKQEESFYALVNGQLVILCKFGNGQFTYTMPVGSGDQKKTILLLKEQADSPLSLYGTFPSLSQWFEDEFLGQFVIFLCVRSRIWFVYNDA